MNAILSVLVRTALVVSVAALVLWRHPPQPSLTGMVRPHGAADPAGEAQGALQEPGPAPARLLSGSPSTLSSVPNLRKWLDGQCKREEKRRWPSIYSPTYNFYFARTAGKTGGTTVEYGYLIPKLCKLFDKRDVHEEEELFGGAKVKAGCIEHLEEMGHLLRKGPKESHSFGEFARNKTVMFTVVRNPCRRATSSYAYCLSEKMRKKVHFGDFLRHPLHMKRFCSTPVRRTPFHYMPQTYLLRRQPLCGDTHIVRTEELNEDMQEVIDRINQQRRPGLPALPPFPKSRHTNEGEHASFRSYTCPGFASCLQALRNSTFRLDMKLLDYETCSWEKPSRGGD